MTNLCDTCTKKNTCSNISKDADTTYCLGYKKRGGK